MATDLYNDGLSDHGLTVEPYAFDPVQDPELQEEVSIEVKFKRYGDYLSLNDLLIEDLNFSLPTPDQVEGVKSSMASIDADVKNEISHRGLAASAFIKKFNGIESI